MKQAFGWWCFNDRGIEPEALLAGAARIGYKGVDLIDERYWLLAAKHGISVTAVAGHGTLTDGLNRRENASRIVAELRANIAKAAQWHIPILICFSGNRCGRNDEDSIAACAETLRRVAPMAAAAGVTLAIELLNSKVDHPDYQCDRTELGIRLCEAVQSPSVKLLYDVYHMQVMEGDVIRTIQRHSGHFAHYHTAGNPGRGELGENQELNYGAIFRAILATGYSGTIAHEFVPPPDVDPLEALARAFAFTTMAGPSCKGPAEPAPVTC